MLCRTQLMRCRGMLLPNWHAPDRHSVTRASSVGSPLELEASLTGSQQACPPGRRGHCQTPAWRPVMLMASKAAGDNPQKLGSRKPQGTPKSPRPGTGQGTEAQRETSATQAQARREGEDPEMANAPPSSGAKLRTNQQPNHRPNQPQTKPTNLAGF